MKNFFMTFMTIVALSLVSTVTLAASTKPATKVKPATTRPSTYESPKAPAMHHTDGKSPWDFTGEFGLYPSGIGFGALAGYRVIDGLLSSANQNDLVVEAGLTYISYSTTFGISGFSSSFSYSLIEIPIMARWDFHAMDNKLVFGPRLGFNYETGYTSGLFSAGGGLFLAIGGDAIYYFSDNFGARVNLSLGGYTTLMFGITYSPN